VSADLGEQIDIPLVGKEQGGARAPLCKGQAKARSRRHAVGLLIVGSNRCPFPCPAEFVEPGAHRFGCDLDPAPEVELRGARRAAPPRATPAERSGRGLEQRENRAVER